MEQDASKDARHTLSCGHGSWCTLGPPMGGVGQGRAVGREVTGQMPRGSVDEHGALSEASTQHKKAHSTISLRQKHEHSVFYKNV